MTSALVQQHITSLYQDNHGWLKNWLSAKLRCSQQAADFTQDTFVKILTLHHSNTTDLSVREPKSYLATIANRLLIDNIRKKALETAYLTALKNKAELVELSPEQQLMAIQTLQLLDAMLYDLGANVRRAFLLSQLKGMPYVDIAKELSVSVSSVKKYMAKATHSCLIFSLEQQASYEQ